MRLSASDSATRFVALGDSITVGLGDPMPDGTWRGWAALLADCLGPHGQVDFHNVAESGALSANLVDRQLAAALAYQPSIAAVVGGVNDVLRGSFDIARTGLALDTVVGGLRRAGAVVLTARLPDPGRMFGLPGSLAQSLARRVGAVNAMTDVIARRHGTVHFDVARHPATYERRMWSVDRLHPSERGHRLLAGGFADLLAWHGFPVHRRPDPEPHNPPSSRLDGLRWLATKGTRWLYDRSADLLPSLAAIALREWWDDACGRARLIDVHFNAEFDRAIAGLALATGADETARRDVVGAAAEMRLTTARS